MIARFRQLQSLALGPMATACPGEMYTDSQGMQAHSTPRAMSRMIVTGTGPAGGEGISKVARVTYLDMIRGWLTFQDPKQFLFFTRTPAGFRAGKEFLQRLKERSENRDKAITVAALQAQLKALRRWGAKKPVDLSKVHPPSSSLAFLSR